MSFNPRAHAGRDVNKKIIIDLILVSIHAPTRGATKVRPSSFPAGNWFQSTRPRGARQSLGVFLLVLEKFQSTRPRGARRQAIFG